MLSQHPERDGPPRVPLPTDRLYRLAEELKRESRGSANVASTVQALADDIERDFGHSLRVDLPLDCGANLRMLMHPWGEHLPPRRRCHHGAGELQSRVVSLDCGHSARQLSEPHQGTEWMRGPTGSGPGCGTRPATTASATRRKPSISIYPSRFCRTTWSGWTDPRLTDTAGALVGLDPTSARSRRRTGSTQHDGRHATERNR